MKKIRKKEISIFTEKVSNLRLEFAKNLMVVMNLFGNESTGRVSFTSSAISSVLAEFLNGNGPNGSTKNKKKLGPAGEVLNEDDPENLTLILKDRLRILKATDEKPNNSNKNRPKTNFRL